MAIIAVKLRRATSFVSFLLPVSSLFAGKLEEKNSLSKQATLAREIARGRLPVPSRPSRPGNKI